MSPVARSHASPDEVLSQFMETVGEQVYTEPTNARRLLLLAKASVEESVALTYQSSIMRFDVLARHETGNQILFQKKRT